MIVNDNKLIYNINTLICIPQEYKAVVDIYEYNFKYVYLFETTNKSTLDFISFVEKNNIMEVTFVDYRLEYELVINKLEDRVNINFIMTTDLASLTADYNILVHNSIIDLCNKGKINRIGVLDENLYMLLKKNYNNVYLLFLDNKRQESIVNKQNEGIGILNESDDPKHSYYNELSAISLSKNQANLLNISQDVRKFVKTFKIKYTEYSDITKIINTSKICLYINFCNSSNIVFLKSMDAGVPCIIGNSNILKGYEKLESYLKVKSDDNIDEITNKIVQINNDKDNILKEYEIFRKDYSNKSKKSINDFLISPIAKSPIKKYEKLLTIGIPVYNVEKYIGACIDSVIKSVNNNNVEIIIVNDGSPDNSEKIILNYQKKFPNLIKYVKQENHGLGHVRNVILKNSKAKYIASIDSDDTINKAFFNEAWKYLEDDVDIVLCDWLSIFKDNEKYTTEAMDNNLNFESSYKKILYSTIMPSTCNKIIKKDLYERINLKFIEGLKFEDLGTNPVIMSMAETICYINQPYYEYNIRENSIMRTKVGYNMIDVLRLLEDRMNKYITDNSFNKKEFIAYVYFWRMEESVLNQLYTLNKDERENMIQYTYNNLQDIIEKLYKGNKYVDELINRVDKETKDYINERNKFLANGNLSKFLDDKINKKEYKVLTPALILYNYDNR